MAINMETRTANVNYESLVLMTVEISHDEETRLVPDDLLLDAVGESGAAAAEKFSFRLDASAATGSEHKREVFVLRLGLLPGRYRLVDLAGDAAEFPYEGRLSVPLAIQITVPRNAVVYAGRIVATSRPSQDAERPDVTITTSEMFVGAARYLLPFYRGNFDVRVQDESASDVPMIRRHFPALERTPIATVVARESRPGP